MEQNWNSLKCPKEQNYLIALYSIISYTNFSKNLFQPPFRINNMDLEIKYNKGKFKNALNKCLSSF